MKSQKFRLIPLVVGLALVTGMIPGAMARGTSSRQANMASVDTHQITTDVSLSYSKRQTLFSGSVSYEAQTVSPNEDECAVDRKVTLFKILRSGADKLGTDTGGAFSFDFRRVSSGTYQVRVAPKTFSDEYGDLVECSGARDSVRV